MKNLVLLFLLFPFSIFAEINFILNTENEPPFSMRRNEFGGFRPDDPLMGISVEILDAVFRRLKISYKMSIDSWDVSYKKALSGENQGVFSTTRTKEREQLFKWVGPLVANDWLLVAKENFEGNIREIRDPNLKKFKIGTLKGGAIDNYLRENGIPTIVFESGFESALALKQEKIDLWAVGGPIAFYYAKKVGAENLKSIFVIKRHQFLYLALNRKIPDNLIEALNRELGIMRRDGTIRDIYRRYQGF